eukprot:gene31933-42607_t
MEVNDQVSRPRVVRKPKNSIPEDLLNNVELNKAISVLPRNYNFEIHKSIWKVLQEKPEITALQFPEGLLMYACIIGDIISRFGGTRIIIFGDVTYGACCIDDFSAHKLGASLIIHYGHSCLIPTSVTKDKLRAQSSSRDNKEKLSSGLRVVSLRNSAIHWNGSRSRFCFAGDHVKYKNS